MSMELRQTLGLRQTLVMTPQLQQAIKLLQLTQLELVDLVREEMDENPMLEEAADSTQEEKSATENDAADGGGEAPEAPPQDKAAEVGGENAAAKEIDWDNYLEKYTMAPAVPANRPSGDELPSLEATLVRRPSLTDHLMWQLNLSRFTAVDEAIATLIIGNVDPDGYIKEPPLSDIAIEAGRPVEYVEAVLKRIQGFDPVGVAARSLSECLLIQARHAGADDDVVVQIIERHLGALEKRKYQAIARDLHQPVEEILLAAEVISSFWPRPGHAYSDEEPVYITPDVYVHRVGDKYFVVPNDDGLPKLKPSSYYRAAMADSPEAKEYIESKLRSAKWLIRSIQQRRQTIIGVTESIVKFQREFFDKGVGYLKPLILRDVADDINRHESTVSRVTTNKYVHTPQGIYELKFFFSSGINRTEGDAIASESVREKIKELVAKEDRRHPHSDQDLVGLLRGQDIDIARRTVAKYREQLGILCSSERRQVSVLP
jgi:RNA polymerase sigma-54 factor